MISPTERRESLLFVVRLGEHVQGGVATDADGYRNASMYSKTADCNSSLVGQGRRCTRSGSPTASSLLQETTWFVAWDPVARDKRVLSEAERNAFS